MVLIDETNKKDCCGCTACASICPKNAITMKEDFEGFLYPVIDKDKCINCGLCDKTCPIKNKNIKKEKFEEAYTLRVKDKEILKSSTSGGFFTPIAEYVINIGGVVYGVGFDEKWNVCHKEAKTIEAIQEFKGSKYVQSDINGIFEKVEDNLKKDKYVLFSGTPCQVEGLKKYLKKDYEKLYTVDLICHGVPSPKLWSEYIKFQEKKYKSKIKEVYFRNKTYGYHSGTMKIVFDNGKEYYGSARVDYMLKSFFKEIASRPSCYDCSFKTRNHISDITIYDCWNIEKLNSDIKDDDLGFTNIIVNSKKGNNILQEIKNKFDIYKVNIDKQIELDGSMVEHSAIQNQNRSFYYRELDKLGIKENVNKYIRVSKKDYLIEQIKSILYKTKLLNRLKKIKGK